VAGLIIDDVLVATQRVDQVAGVLGFVAVHQPLEHPKHTAHMLDVGPINSLEVLLGLGSSRTAVLVPAVGVGGETLVLEGRPIAPRVLPASGHGTRACCD
jgi:hypothetical protein